MRRYLTTTLALVLLGPALWALDQPKSQSKSDKSSAAQQAYENILQTYEKADENFQKALNDAKTPQEKQQAQSKRPNIQNFSLQFLSLAQKYPKAQAAEKALGWIVQKSSPQDPVAKEAADLLVKNYLKSEELGPVCQILANYPGTEKKLRQIAEKNPHKEVQGQAFLALAQLLKNQSEGVSGNKEKAAKEAENMLQLAVEKYSEVETPQGTIGDRAKALQADIKEFGYGHLLPDISGEDIDGKAMKLSDYLGKVVLLDFWGNW